MARYLFSLPETASTPVRSGPSRFVKDVIRAGRFFVPHLGLWLDVDTQRIDDWVTQFARMKANGVNVPLTIDHDQSADSVRGHVTRLYRDGAQLKMECEVADPESETLLARCPHVSLELEKSFTDGHGDQYPEAITAVTITPKPVVPDQEPFQKIAASRASGKGDVIIFHLRTNEVSKSQGHLPAPARSQPMPITLTAEQATALLTALGLSGIPDEQVGTKLVEGVTGLATKARERDRKVADLGGELATVKASLTEAAKGKAPDVDTDALEEAAEGVQTKLGLLVERNRITPAVKTKLETLFLGAAGSRPAMCLSRKAATHAGLSAPLAKAVIEALEDNDPAALAKRLGEKSGPQTVTLSRSTPDGDTAPDKESVATMEDAAFGPARQ